ncbi:MAG: hypothetical protein A2Z04_05420 [Chloroflexi bacterium RBG_16_57_9]|nr:MAG: hypothetical protein A2Z04_05420 [Chloroflexi bacterium RBG_16_57_9]
MLTIMMLSVAWSIQSSEWSEGLWVLQFGVLGGLVFGIILAWIRRLPGILAHLLAIAVGIAWTVFLVAWLLPWEYTWPQALSEIAERFGNWIQVARGQGISLDNLVFVMQLCFLIWLVGYFGAWFMVRFQNVWGAIIPSGFTMLFNLYYAAPEIANFLFLYLVAALLLVVRSYIILQEREWQAARVGYSPDIGLDFLRDGVIFAILAITVAWYTPTAESAPQLYAVVDRIEGPLNRMQTEFNRLFASLNYRPRPGPAYFTNSMTVSGPVNLGDAPVFDAQVEGNGSVRYWRSVVYDEYTGRGWINTDAQSALLNPGDMRLATVPFDMRVPITQTISFVRGGNAVLVAAAQPAQFSMPVRAQFSSLDLEVSTPGLHLITVSMLQSRTPLKTGQSYTVVSAVSAADLQSLRGAGKAYPESITRRYLQVPDAVPARVRELARQVASPYTNDYDKAAAIEAYMRRLTYNENVDAPPPGRDWVDYFLFDLKQGYCDYYASAFVIMARIAGIPARVAAGYARGEYDSTIGGYRQRDYDAHSWPEVFFPKYGWIEFEPTASDPLITRPETASVVPDSQNPDSNAGGRDPNRQGLDKDIEDVTIPLGPLGNIAQLLRSPVETLMDWIWPLLGILGALGVTLVGVWIAWNRELMGLSLVEQAYARMARLGRFMGVREAPYDTPHEYARKLARAVPEGREDIGQITEGYVWERFSGRQLTPEEGSKLAKHAIHLQQLLRKALAEGFLSRMTGQRRGARRNL